MDPVVSIDQIWKRFVVRHNRIESLKELVIGWVNWKKRERREEFWALKGVSLSVEKGQMVGVIGPNGSGKSTLLRVVAGILFPEKGLVTVRGRVAPMIELGVGFHPELTGEENLFLNAALYGLDQGAIHAIKKAIIEFSELGSFIDVPIKNYSTGMVTRLGFSIAVHLGPDILLVDEVLAVGDRGFQEKCLRTMEELKRGGTSVLFVSHDMEQIVEQCDKVYLIAKGKEVFSGSPSEAVARYTEQFRAFGPPESTAL